MTSFRSQSHWGLAAVLALAPWLSQCTSEPTGPLPTPPPMAVPEAPKVSQPVFLVGDQLELFVKEDVTLNGSYLVREGGYIVIPRAGRINVAGLTREAVEPRVKEFLQKTQLKEANVIVERTPGPNNTPAAGASASQGVPRILVYLTGSVSRAGGHSIAVPPGKSVGVYETLLISGGLGKFALLEKVEVFRTDSSGKRKKSIVDLRRVMKGEADDPPIAEGDIINVPEKVFGF